jgi:hypothetical protein
LLTPRGAVALLIYGAALTGSSAAHALCTAAQISLFEPACATTGVMCFISSRHTIDDGCTIDFGNRDVTFLPPSGGLTVGSRSATLRAGSVTVGGAIDGVGNGPGAPRGGMVKIETSRDVVVGQLGRIDVSGIGGAGEIMITAGGAVSIAGRVQADFLNVNASGGLIVINAVGSINSTDNAVISARGGIDSSGGGEIDLIAGGTLTVQSDLDVGGFDGGIVNLEAGSKITIEGVDASGLGDAGSGGCIDAVAGSGVEIQGELVANGVTGTFMTGGCGGFICLDAGFGDLLIANNAVLAADGASPDGGGGQIGLLANGNGIVRGAVSARGPIGETCGGDVCAEFGYDFTLLGSGSVDVSGGDSGGLLEVLTARNLTINGDMDASGRQAGSLAGDVTLFAGLRGRGTLTITGNVDARSDPRCSAENGCGLGGIIDLEGCDVTLTNQGSLLASGPDGGENNLTARAQLTVRGTVDATSTVPSGTAGGNRLVHPMTRSPIVQISGIDPPHTLVSVVACPATGPTQPSCLIPCPLCGNGTVEFPETCDRGMMPPMSCSGCSIYCETENCNDGRTCTGDSCNANFGCINEPTPGCQEPTRTATGTPPTATATRTPSATASATSSTTPTQTPVVSFTPTASPTRSASATPSAMATATTTSSPISTASATVTVSATATLTASETPSPNPTTPAVPACAGDCDGSANVAVNELIVAVNIALGNASVSACLAADRNRDGSISIGELIAAVGASLNGC